MNRLRRRAIGRESASRKDSGISVDEEEKAATRKAVLEDMKMQGPNAFDTEFPTPWRTAEHKRTVQPSPLGLSNYDALDDEDGYGYYDDEVEEGEEPQHRKEKIVDSDGSRDYYSDWNTFDHSHDTKMEDDDDKYDDPFSLSVLPSGIATEKRPPSPPDNRVMELMKEKERQREVLFLQFE